MTNGVSSKMLFDAWSALIKEKEESGLTTTEYCKKHRLAPSNYYYWYRKVKGTGKGGTTQRLKEIRQARREEIATEQAEYISAPLMVIRFGPAEIFINKDTPDDLIFKVLTELRRAS